MSYTEFKQQYPNFSLATQYAPAGTDLNSYVCFYNFYSQVFAKETVPVQLHFFFFNALGDEVGHVVREVPSHGFLHFDILREFGSNDGLVAVAAIPQSDLAKIKPPALKLKRHLGSGFYTIWKDSSGHVDTMHEWYNVDEFRPKKQTHFMLVNCDKVTRPGMVLVNPNSSSVPSVLVQVYDQARKILGTNEIEGLNPLGSRRQLFQDIFPEFQNWCTQYPCLGVAITAEGLVPPFTYESHTSGDFHFHHLI